MYSLSSEVYLDKYDDQYKSILVVESKSISTDISLSSYVRRVNLYKYDRTNPFRYNDNVSRNCCAYGFVNIDEGINCNFQSNEYVRTEDLPSLIVFLQTKGYTIDTSLSKVMFMNKNHSNKNFIGFIKKI